MGVVERNFNSIVPFKRLSVRIQPQSKPTFVVIVTSAKILGPIAVGGRLDPRRESRVMTTFVIVLFKLKMLHY